MMKFIVHCREEGILFFSVSFYISDVLYNQNRTTKSHLSDIKQLLSKLDKFRHECKWLNLCATVYFVLFCNKFDMFSEIFLVVLLLPGFIMLMVDSKQHEYFCMRDPCATEAMNSR